MTPSRSAVSIARSDGADTAQTIGIPATAAFWTISKLTRPRDHQDPVVERHRAGEDLRADQLVERVVAADVLAHREELAARREQARPRGGRRSRRTRAGRRAAGRAGRGSPSARRPARRGSGSARRATSSIEALPQIPHDAVATKCRSATFESSNGRDSRTDDRVVGLAQRRRVAGRSYRSTSWPSSRPSVRRKPDRELGLVAGRPHRDRDRDRVLARAGGPDLERRLADDAVVADLERVAADRHDPPAGHVPGRRAASPPVTGSRSSCVTTPAPS